MDDSQRIATTELKAEKHVDFDVYKSLPKEFLEQADKHPKTVFLASKIDGRWKKTSYAKTLTQVEHLAKGLRLLGVNAGDRVALVSENSPNWAIADLGIMASGAIAVPAYVTNTEADHKHILTNSGAKGVIVSTRALAAKVLPAAIEAPECEFVITIEPMFVQQRLPVDVHVWDAVLDAGRTEAGDVRAWVDAIDPNDTACLIYTSGTGGVPKGVMLSHRAVRANCLGAIDVLHDWPLGQERFLSFLPLSHAYEHAAGLHLPIHLGAEIYYAESVDKLVENLGEVRPTIMTAVPRLFEAIRTKIQRGLKDAPEFRKKLFIRAQELGRAQYEGRALSFKEKCENAVLERLVRSKVRARFGGRLKAFVAGGAALNQEVGLFFQSLGVTILQGYGQTEAAPVISVNRRKNNKLDTVGKPLHGVETKIADDGEIIIRGPLLMNGYWRNEEAMKKTVVDGWLHTGDIGEIDDDGYIKITDRKKDIIVLSGGDNVSPARVEGFLCLEPEIGQAMVYGDKKPYLTALLVPDDQFLADFAKAQGVPANLEELVANKALRKQLDDAVGRVNQSLANLEKIRKFVICDQEFTTENAMMTPSLKVRRHIVKEHYGDALEAQYRR